MARAATTTDVFNAVGDPTRRRIIELLSAAEASVGDLVMALDVEQPLVSKHLKVLRDVNAVHSRNVGRNRVYALHRDGFAPIDDWLQRLRSNVNEHYDRLDDYLDALQHTTPPASRKGERKNR